MIYDYEHWKCKKKLVDKLVDECTETVEELKLAKITLAENENKHKCTSWTMLMIAVFTICARNSIYFVYYNSFLVKNVSSIQFNTRTQTTI